MELYECLKKTVAHKRHIEKFHIMEVTLSLVFSKLSLQGGHCVCSAAAASSILLGQNYEPLFVFFISFSQLTVFSACLETTKTQVHPIAPILLHIFKSHSHPPTPSYSFPSSPLFSWSLHSTPPLQTGHKRERTTPDLWQAFQSSRPFHIAGVPYPISFIWFLFFFCPVLLNWDNMYRWAKTKDEYFLETFFLKSIPENFTFLEIFVK